MSARDDASESTHVRALTAQLHAASENLATLSRELSRSRIVAALVRSIQQLGVGSPIADDLASRFLQVVIEQTLCDTAALLQNRGRRGEFVTIQAIGHGLQSQSEELNLPGIPSFLALPGGLCPSHVTSELHRAYGRGSTLWSLHAESGLALLLYSKPNATIKQGYGDADRELIETALSLYVASVNQRRINRTLFQSKQSAESRLCSSRTMMVELLDILHDKLDMALVHLSVVEIEKISAIEQKSEDLAVFDINIGEVRSSISESVELIGISKDMVCAEKIPVSVDLSWVKLGGVLEEVSNYCRDEASSRGIKIRVSAKTGEILVYVDEVWVREILHKIVANVLNEATSNSTVTLSHARRSDGLTSITVIWNGHDTEGSVQESRIQGSVSNTVREPPLSAWESEDVVRLIDAYGGTLIREVTNVNTRQVVWTFSSGE